MVRQVRRGVAAGVLTAVAMAGAPPADAQTGLKRWLFAEGSTSPVLPFEEEILIGNPNGTQANVTFTFLRDDGSAPIVVPVTVMRQSRQGFNVQGMVGDLNGVALEVTSDIDIVVERSMYWGGGRFNFPQLGSRPITDMRAGHNSAGVNETRTSWSFAEGSAGFFQTYILVSNPSATSATVAVKYLTSLGEELSETREIAAGARQTFFANEALGALGRPQVDFATEVIALNGVGVVAERAMYWNGFAGGHSAVGVAPRPSWLFAEGVQAPILDTYVLLFNPNPEPITVEVNFYGPDGLLQQVLVPIDARRRAQVFAGSPEYPALHNQAFSISAVSAGNRPFVAERAVYRTYGGVLGDGTVAAGIPAPALRWGFADGQEGGFQQFQNPSIADLHLFHTYYQVLNTNDVPVSVRGVFYLEPNESDGIGGGVGVETTVVVNPRSRGTFSPSLMPGLHNRKFAAFFEASGPVVMERAMYWGEGIKGGHASGGTVLPNTVPAPPPPAAVPAPIITGISPNRGTAGGGTLVTITGAGIGLKSSGVLETRVAFGVTPVPPQNITVNNANSISLVTPPSGKGFASVIVSTRGAELELPGAFEFFDPFVAGPPISFGNLEGVVAAVAAARPFDLLNSCGNHTFMFEVVAELRRRFRSNRWGLNWKRGNVGDLSEDIVNYYSGPEGTVMRNSTQVRIYDMIGGHCGGRPSPFWVDQTGPTRAAGTVGRWTTDPMCRVPRYRDARYDTGEFMFPECR